MQSRQQVGVPVKQRALHPNRNMVHNVVGSGCLGGTSRPVNEGPVCAAFDFLPHCGGVHFTYRRSSGVAAPEMLKLEIHGYTTQEAQAASRTRRVEPSARERSMQHTANCTR